MSRSDRCTRHSTGCSLVYRAKDIQWIPGEILSAMRQLEAARCDPGFHDNYRTKQSRASNSPRHFNHSEAAARCRCRQHSIKRGSLCPTEWLMRASRSNQPVVTSSSQAQIRRVRMRFDALLEPYVSRTLRALSNRTEMVHSRSQPVRVQL
jgi:hypothetical protein